MTHLRPLFVFLLLTASFAGFASAAPSKAMKRILHERLVGKYDVRVDGLLKLPWTAAKLERLDKRNVCEVYHVPYPPHVADYLTYTILRFRERPQFLVVISGGLAGVFYVYSSPAR